MKSRTQLDRSVIQAQMESEQMQTEGILYSVGIHVFFILLALNFHLIEKYLGLTSNKIKKSEQIEISIIESPIALTNPAPEGLGQLTENLESNIATAPDLQTRDADTTVQVVEEKNDNTSLAQKSASQIKEAELHKGDVNQQTAESREAASRNQAEIQLNLLRERQKQVQKEIDLARQKIELKNAVEQDVKRGVSNLVEEDKNESDMAFVEAENENYSDSSGYSAPDEFTVKTGGTEFVININQISAAQGQQPCPSDKTYHNPANDCKPYTQTLYKPLCYYVYDECLVHMKKYKDQQKRLLEMLR